MKRRDFIKGCAAGLGLVATTRLRMMAAPFLPVDGSNQIFVLIFLRGGCDGLGLVAPASDQVYQDARPPALKVMDRGKEAGLLLDNGLAGEGFRLHPKARALHELYEQGDLAILHACGLPNGTRSHFEAMELIERGLLKKSGRAEGWMARYFNAMAPEGLIPAAATSGNLPAAMQGYGKAASLSKLEDFNLLDFVRKPDLLRKWYGKSDLLGQAATSTLDTIRYVQQELVSPQGRKIMDQEGAYPDEWPGEELSNSLQTLAQMIKLDLGVQIGQVDFDGWDTHEHQQYHFPNRVEALSEAIAAFYNDLHAYHDRLTVLVMSEFGRRLRANRSSGTDHGYGNMMMVLGNKVKGGRMYGRWPGLAPYQLDKGVDLAITTDYRQVLGEILAQRMELGSVGKVFPEFELGNRLGFLA